MYKEYYDALHKLPRKEPNAETLQRLLPHKHPAIAEALLEKWHETYTENYIAVPPLRVQGAFHILQFHLGYPQKFVPPRIRWYAAARIEELESTINPYPMINIHEALYAAAFAEEHWGRKLVKDNWKEFGIREVQGIEHYFTIGRKGKVREAITDPLLAAEYRGTRDITLAHVPLEQIMQKARGL